MTERQYRRESETGVSDESQTGHTPFPEAGKATDATHKNNRTTKHASLNLHKRLRMTAPEGPRDLPPTGSVRVFKY